MTPAEAVGTATAWALAATFAVAATTKLRSPAATVTEFRRLLVPAPRVVARVLPAGEVALAVVLVALPRPGAVLAAAVVAVFTAVLVRAIGRGVTGGCACFGASAAAGLGPVVVARNALLFAAATVAAATAPARAGQPGLAATVLVGTTWTVAAVALGVARLRETIGPVWAVRVPAAAGAPAGGSDVGNVARGRREGVAP